ncbi:hexokinase-1-like [Cucumis melo var. makuwa]|uniref:Phosphotransferase n=1 Tax=Cucumis melo var. makuwa TaxID=1194695 RepID=A0A5A7SY25_CUCMM|nr:hexokinase-1-like [Cucumis melo var. makuwa]TYK31029.1 hexokinase-1-like [Cucumis melo var. makuwa]
MWVGQDVVGELTKAMEILIGYACGDFDRGRYHNDNVIAAEILGIGTNVAYMERTHAIPKWQGLLPQSGEMVSKNKCCYMERAHAIPIFNVLSNRQVIKMEWGNFRSSHLPFTEYDQGLDLEILNPGEQVKVLFSLMP